MVDSVTISGLTPVASSTDTDKFEIERGGAGYSCTRANIISGLTKSTAQAAAPSGPANGDTWRDTDDEKFYVSDGTNWFLTGTLTTVGATKVLSQGSDYITEGTTNVFYTDERAQDAIGTILTDSSSIDFTYDDGTPSITASIKSGGITSAMLGTGTILETNIANNAVTTTKLSVTGASAGSYTNASITVGVDGRITSVSSGSGIPTFGAIETRNGSSASYTAASNGFIFGMCISGRYVYVNGVAYIDPLATSTYSTGFCIPIKTGDVYYNTSAVTYYFRPFA